MALSRQEQETGIIWNEADDSCLLWTTSAKIKRRMRERMGPPTKIKGVCEEWTFLKSWVRLPAKPRVLSEAAREKAAERLAKVRAQSDGKTGQTDGSA